MSWPARAHLTGARLLLGAVSLAAVSLLPACAHATRSHDASEQSALLVTPSPQTRAELVSAVDEALNGAPIRLADDALTRESTLVITRVQPRDASGRPIMGRITEKPERFELVVRGGACLLIQERTQRRWLLHSAQCAPSSQR